jgi:hypothetical protein
MAKGWSREFDDPIPLPRGRQLVTLKDAGKGGDGSPARPPRPPSLFFQPCVRVTHGVTCDQSGVSHEEPTAYAFQKSKPDR